MIEDYGEGLLEEAERQGFQKMFYANPQRRIEVQVVERLKQHAATKWWTRLFRATQDKVALLNSGKPRGATLASADASPLVSLLGFRKAAIAFALVIAVALAFFITQRFLRSGQAPPSLTQEQQRHERIQRELARLNSRESLPTAVAATLSPGLSRGGETIEFPIVTLPRGAESAHLRLRLLPSDQEYQAFHAMLTPVGARESYQIDLRPVELNPGVSALNLTLPAQTLDDGDYSIQLSGQTADGGTQALADHYYYFRLVRQ